MFSTRWTAVFAAAALLGGCSDSNEPNGDVTLADLAGTWQVTKWEYTNTANTSETIDLKALGASATLTLEGSGDYSISGTFGGVPINLTGTYAVNGSTLVINEDGADGPQTVSFTLSGDTWTITGLDGDWDFDEDGTDDAATLIIVFTRS